MRVEGGRVVRPARYPPREGWTVDVQLWWFDGGEWECVAGGDWEWLYRISPISGRYRLSLRVV